MIQEYLSLFLAFSALFFVGFRLRKELNLFISSFLIIGLGIVLVEASMLVDLLSYRAADLGIRVLITSLFSYILLITTYLTIKLMNKKKRQVLWKVPIVGALAGFYFEFNYIPYICTGYLIVSTFILYSAKGDYGYLVKKLLRLIPAIAAVYFINDYKILALNITLILIIIGISPILDLVLISSKFKKANS